MEDRVIALSGVEIVKYYYEQWYNDQVQPFITYALNLGVADAEFFLFVSHLVKKSPYIKFTLGMLKYQVLEGDYCSRFVFFLFNLIYCPEERERSIYELLEMFKSPYICSMVDTWINQLYKFKIFWNKVDYEYEKISKICNKHYKEVELVYFNWENPSTHVSDFRIIQCERCKLQYNLYKFCNFMG